MLQYKKGEDMKKDILYNCFGQEISRKSLQYSNAEYGIIDSDGIPHTNWEEETDFRDRDGFDKLYRPVQNSDQYIIEGFVIPKGMVICRYGSSFGFFTTVKGSDYDQLSLPYRIETIEYHEYKVSADLKVDCIVTKGRVAPMFGSKGGAIQFRHRQAIRLECQDGKMQEVYSWLH